jgi:outer membrane receptor protein involved in Fe transport
MEFESMILNLGVRLDYLDPNREWFHDFPYFNLGIDPSFDAGADPDRDQVDSLGHVKYSFENVLRQPRKPSPSYVTLSPRLGVSFPITENTLVRLNYGHFYQVPPLDRMFEFAYFRPVYIVKGIIEQKQNPMIQHVPSNDGDPERVVFLTLSPLKPEKTISFEVGIKHNFGDLAVLDVTGFYKDVTDQTEPRVGLFDRSIYGFDPFTGRITPNVAYASYFPGDYGDSRGFEISFRTLFSRTYTLDVNYSFSRATQGRASPGRIYINADGSVRNQWDADVSRRIPTEKSYSRPNILRANLYLRYPDPEGPASLFDEILRGTSASILYRVTSGQSFTYVGPSDPPDTYDNQRYPASHTVDLRVEKTIVLGGTHAMTLSMRVTNLLNTKNLRSYGDIFFDANATRKYVEAGEVTEVDGAGYNISWQTYFEPRRFYFGVKYEF